MVVRILQQQHEKAAFWPLQGTMGVAVAKESEANLSSGPGRATLTRGGSVAESSGPFACCRIGRRDASDLF